MQKSAERSSGTASQANETGLSISSIVESVEEIKALNTQIAAATEEQSAATGEIQNRIDEMFSNAKTTHQSSGEVSGIMSGLKRTAIELDSVMDGFKVS